MAKKTTYWPNVDDFDAVILGLGGVITQTAPLHAEAWHLVMNDFLGKWSDGKKVPRPFDEAKDYPRFIAGRACEEAVGSFLNSRGIKLPKGDYDDGPEEETLWGLGNRKDLTFRKLMQEKGASVFPDTLEQIHFWRERGLKIAVVSFSREASKIIASTQLASKVDVLIDGIIAARQHLEPAPSTDSLLYASLMLNVDPQRIAVIDDTIASMEAARDAGFGLAIGIDRHGNKKIFEDRGAQMVVSTVGALADPTQGKSDRRTWTRPPSALKCAGQIKQLLGRKRVALFFDYDGTLTPIVSRPEDAILSEEMREVLKETALICPVAIVSGRDRADVEKLVDMPDLIYAGSHGFDITGPDRLNMQLEEGKIHLPTLDKAEKELAKRLKKISGHQVDRKKFAIAIHYRNVSETDSQKVESIVDEVLKEFPTLRKGGGKKVFELRPDIDWDKGKAVLWLLDALKLDKKDIVPIYVGDDVTDEDAFEALKERGLGIIVGRVQRKTAAQYSLETVDEVKTFLLQLIGYTEDDQIEDGWRFVYDEFNPEQESLREALCTLGNGYFCTRGAAEESTADETHYPGTYVAGGYNRLTTEIAGRDIENEDLVNWPNWLPLTFRHPGEEWFKLEDVTILSYKQELDLKRGTLHRKIRFRDAKERITSLHCRRLVHMGNHHLAAIQWNLLPETWSGTIEISSALDGTVINAGVKRYRELNSEHLAPIDTAQPEKDRICLRVRATQSRVEMAQAARIQVFQDGQELNVKRKTTQKEKYIAQELTVDCQRGTPLTVEKTVSLYTSRDHAISEPGLEACHTINAAERFDRLWETHTRPWAQLWNQCDIRLDGNSYAQLILRMHVFHILQTVSPNSIELDIGIPARGWHGEAYRGHIFWDEIFIFPFINFRIPMLTRSLLMYRYRRLPEARRNAKLNGYKGAMYPWQSGSSGREETQVLHLNPKSGRWLPDNTHRQVHINIAIVFNVWQYFTISGDLYFLSHYGAKMILEIARFFSSLATYNEKRKKFEIHGVVGPDEYHTRYPNSDEPGLHNNAYTNLLAAWVLWRAQDVLDLLPETRNLELRRELEINDRERSRWNEISRNMFVPFHNGNIISQFEGYEILKEFDWQAARKKWGDIQRLDRILEANGDSTNNYKLAKQCDVLMLFYLFSSETLGKLFERLGYTFDPKMIGENIEYYQQRTSHGSTLSRIVHSWVLARADREKSWQYFVEALKSDVEDIQGGTTPEGIHLGAMAGTVDLIQRGDLGIVVLDDVLWLNPCLPAQLPKLSLRLHFRGRWLKVQATASDLRVIVEEGGPGEIKLGYRGEVYTVSTKQTLVWPI